MEIKAKYLLAPTLGLSIAMPIIALAFYFFFQNDFSLGLLTVNELLDYFQNTLTLIIGTSLIILIIGVISSFLNARFEYFGSRFFGIAFLLPLAYPAYILGYCYVGFFEFHGILSELLGMNLRLDILNIYGAIFIFSIAMYPYVYILARVSFASISSTTTELIALHQISLLRQFFTIYLPLAYPAIFAGIILATMEIISDYGTVVYFGIDTFSVGIFKNWFGYNDLVGAINIAVVLLIFVFIILYSESKAREKYRFVSATNSSKTIEKIKLKGFGNFFAFIISLLIFIITFFLPTSILVYWFIQDYETLDLDSFGYMYNTLNLNIISSLLIISFAFLMLYFGRMYPSKVGNIIQKVSTLGYSIPGAVIALGVLIFSNIIDKQLGTILLNGTMAMLIIAYLTRYFAVSIGSLENGFSKIDRTVDDTTKIFSHSETKNFFVVYLPLMRPYLISGFLVLYIDIAKELPATLLLRPFNFDTMAIRIYELSSNEMLYKIAFPSLMLVSSTIIAVLLLNSNLIKGKK